MSAVSQPRKHHYLPQFYLQHFASNRRLIQIEKKTGKSYPMNIRDVAAIRDYHRIDHDETDDQFQIEKGLSQIEDLLSGALSQVLANGITNPDTKMLMVELVSFLRMRVPAIKTAI